MLEAIGSTPRGLYESAFESGCNPENGRYRRRVQELPPFTARTDEEVESLVAEWRQLVHPRVEECAQGTGDTPELQRTRERSYRARLNNLEAP